MGKTFRVLFTRRMLICVFIGFSSGLPFFLLINLLPAWLLHYDIKVKTIGFFALVQFPFTWKFLWSPLLDRYAFKDFGRRRSWMLVSQIALLLSIGFLGGFSPATQLTSVLNLCTLIAFFAATQDIALDAYRREILDEASLGLGNSIHVNAYRVAGLIPGSLSLILADRYLPWDAVFWVTAAFMLPGLLMTLCVSEPTRVGAPKTLRQSIIEPFAEFISRAGVKSALVMLAFVFFYKLGDSLCTSLATVFYLDMGYTKTDVGLVAKNATLWPAVIGATLGGLWMVRIGINRALWLFGFVQVFSIFGFAALALQGKQAIIGVDQYVWLAVVISFESLGVGLGTAAFVAYIARATHPAYTATQFALFTSLAAVPRTFVNASAGWMVSQVGWFNFYLICAALAVPGMLLLLRVAPWNEARPLSENVQDEQLQHRRRTD